MGISNCVLGFLLRVTTDTHWGPIEHPVVKDVELNQVLALCLVGMQASGEVVQIHQSAQVGIKANKCQQQAEKWGPH